MPPRRFRDQYQLILCLSSHSCWASFMKLCPHQMRAFPRSTMCTDSAMVPSEVTHYPSSSSVQLLSRVRLFVTPWIAACQKVLNVSDIGFRNTLWKRPNKFFGQPNSLKMGSGFFLKESGILILVTLQKSLVSQSNCSFPICGISFIFLCSVTTGLRLLGISLCSPFPVH